MKQWTWQWGMTALAALLIVVSLHTFVPGQSKIQVLNGAGIIDQADVISPSNETELNQITVSLNASAGARVIVLTMPDLGAAPTVEDYADELFDAWEMGRTNIENGVLLLLVTDDRTAAIRAGSGILAVLSDDQLQSILNERVMPQLRDGNFDRSILRGTGALAVALEGETLTPSVFSRQRYRRWTRWPVYHVWRGSYWIGRTVFNPVWVAVGMIVGAIAALLIYLRKIKEKTLCIQPVGVSDVTGLAEGNLISGLGWLIDTAISLGLQRQSEYDQSRQLAGQGMLIDYSRAMQKSVCLMFALLLGVSLVTLVYLWQSLGNWMGTFAWIVLVFGLSAGEFWWQARRQSIHSKPYSAKHSVASAFFQSFLMGFGLNLPLVVVSGGVWCLIIPFVLAAWMGTCALITRLHRLYLGDTTICCQQCGSAMKQLYGRHFKNSIHGERQTWHCATCFPDPLPASENFHVLEKRKT